MRTAASGCPMQPMTRSRSSRTIVLGNVSRHPTFGAAPPMNSSRTSASPASVGACSHRGSASRIAHAASSNASSRGQRPPRCGRPSHRRYATRPRRKVRAPLAGALGRAASALRVPLAGARGRAASALRVPLASALGRAASALRVPLARALGRAASATSRTAGARTSRGCGAAKLASLRRSGVVPARASQRPTASDAHATNARLQVRGAWSRGMSTRTLIRTE